MNELRTYCVGGHLFALNIPNGLLSEKELSAYAPFQTDSSIEEFPLFHLSLLADANSLPSVGTKIADFKDENGHMAVFSAKDGSMIIHLSKPNEEECCRIWFSCDYSIAKAWIAKNSDIQHYAFDTTLMLLYTFASSKHGTILIHASAVEYDGKGYVFLGKSGTGKSTHSRLWLETIEGAELLNDDNPIVRIVNGNVKIYGSPWSGKTPCYLNRCLPLGGIVRLHQAPYNKIIPLCGIQQAYASLLPSCSCMKWDHDMAECIHKTISMVIENVSVYNMECLPDAHAARLCRNVITAKNEWS